MPVRLVVTDGTTSDASQVGELIEGIEAEYFLADRAYDTNDVIEQVIDAQMAIVIPPKRNRREKREYRTDIYEKRHKIENTFLKMKQWRGIATRYSKKESTYLASAQICAMFVWLHIS